MAHRWPYPEGPTLRRQRRHRWADARFPRRRRTSSSQGRPSPATFDLDVRPTCWAVGHLRMTHVPAGVARVVTADRGVLALLAVLAVLLGAAALLVAAFGAAVRGDAERSWAFQREVCLPLPAPLQAFAPAPAP